VPQRRRQYEMMKIITRLGIATVVAVASLCIPVQGQQAAAPAAIVLKPAAVLDPQSGQMTRGAVVLVRGERIEASGPSVTPPAGARVIELGGLTLLPGLVDAHTHVLLQPEDEDWPPPVVYKTQSFRTIQGVAAVRKELEAGFTTLRDVDSEGAGFADVDLREAINRGIIPGPRLLVATLAISITAGHMNLTGVNHELRLPDLAALADTRDAMIAEVRRQVKGGADWIKIYATGTLRHVDRKTLEPVDQLSLDDVQALVTEARRWRKDVAAHAYGGDGAKDAIRGGVRSIEHGMLLDDEAVDLLKKHGTYWVPTLVVYTAGLAADKTDFTRRIVERHKQSFQKALAGGAKIVFGTDAGAIQHGTQAVEFARMVEYGMKPLEAIRAATTMAAELLRMEGQIGALTPGAYADIIAVEGNPLEDITALQRVRFVMKGGSVVKREAGS
jgi:imidazolonepropionase-like amidohydrolase